MMLYCGIDFHGYLVFPDGTITNKKTTKFHIHRLVYQLYVAPLKEGEICCHNDNNKLNNHYENLRADSQKNNIADKLRHGTWQAGDTHPRAKYTDKQIEDLQIFMKKHPHLSDLYVATVSKLPRTLVYDVRRGRRKTRIQRIADREKNVLLGN